MSHGVTGWLFSSDFSQQETPITPQSAQAEYSPKVGYSALTTHNDKHKAQGTLAESPLNVGIKVVYIYILFSSDYSQW